MCGRFDFHGRPADLQGMLGSLDVSGEVRARFNIAPTNLAWVVYEDPQHSEQASSSLMARPMHFGWQLSGGPVRQVLNGRAETLRERPLFRAALGHRRCVVLAHGFYEWRRENSKKQPHYFSLPEGAPFVFAGLYQARQSESSRFVILTTDAQGAVAPIHARMPVMLHAAAAQQWLCAHTNTERAHRLLDSPLSMELASWPVSPQMNRPMYDAPDAIAKHAACA